MKADGRRVLPCMGTGRLLKEGGGKEGGGERGGGGGGGRVADVLDR